MVRSRATTSGGSTYTSCALAIAGSKNAVSAVVM